MKKKINNEVTRHYEIRGLCFTKKIDSTKKIVYIFVKDLKKDSDDWKKRREVSHTCRKLLDKNIIKQYQYIDCNVSSTKDIYKIKRFLTYRSDMIMYFQLINDFLVSELKKNKEIYKVEKLHEVEKITKMLNKRTEQYITSHNNHIEKINKKNKDKQNFEARSTVEVKKITEDEVKNIIKVLSCYRHSLMHYEYDFFENLFTGNEVKIKNKDNEDTLSNLLNISIFSEIEKLNKIKASEHNNYLNKDDKIEILGKYKKITKLNNIYNEICARYNGVNPFINSILNNDGVENEKVKEKITEHFNERKSYIEKRIQEHCKNKEELKSELREITLLEKNNLAPYCIDIHKNKAYKKLYVEHKDLVQELNNLEKQNNKKSDITKKQKKIKELKDKMKKLTDVNSKYRLKYKLILFYGFMYKNYELNLNNFKNQFNTLSNNEKELLKNDWCTYIDAKISDKHKKLFDINTLDRSVADLPKVSFYENSLSNNYIKFNTMMYSLLPVEFRGDYLGLSKKIFYEFKNVDNVIKTRANNDFYHKVRLFDKNIKNISFINYNMTDFLDSSNQVNRSKESYIQKIKEITGINNDTYIKVGFMPKESEIVSAENRNETDFGGNEKFLFTKAYYLSIFKFYRNIEKAINEVELMLLLKYICKGNCNSIENIKSIEDAMNSNKHGKYYNFRKLVESVTSESFAEDIKCFIDKRNEIAHLNYNKIFFGRENFTDNIALFQSDLKKLKKNCNLFARLQVLLRTMIIL